jgi:hypothetical protein
LEWEGELRTVQNLFVEVTLLYRVPPDIAVLVGYVGQLVVVLAFAYTIELDTCGAGAWTGTSAHGYC